LASLFHGNEPTAPVAAPTSAYVPPKQPKKGIFKRNKRSRDLFFFVEDSPPKIMTSCFVQAFQL
jgi:hypothetical protein